MDGLHTICKLAFWFNFSTFHNIYSLQINNQFPEAHDFVKSQPYFKFLITTCICNWTILWLNLKWCILLSWYKLNAYEINDLNNNHNYLFHFKLIPLVPPFSLFLWWCYIIHFILNLIVFNFKRIDYISNLWINSISNLSRFIFNH